MNHRKTVINEATSPNTPLLPPAMEKQSLANALSESTISNPCQVIHSWTATRQIRSRDELLVGISGVNVVTYM